MAKSILLLIEKRNGGKGPEIPIRQPILTVTAEGVAESDHILIHSRTPEGVCDVHRLRTGMIVFQPAIEAGSYLRAELVGNNSVATVWVE